MIGCYPYFSIVLGTQLNNKKGGIAKINNFCNSNQGGCVCFYKEFILLVR